MRYSKVVARNTVKRFLRGVIAFLALYPTAYSLSPVYASITQSLSYQGFLLSRAANLAVDSPQDIKFVLYDAPQAGTALFTEFRCNVPVLKGRYDVEIGSTTAGGIPSAVFQSDSQIWLEIQIDPDGDCSGAYESMLPRIKMQASPYAFSSLYASTAAAATAVFLADTIGSLPQTTNGAITISTNLFVLGGISVGAISPGQKLSVAGIVESTGPGGGFMFPDGSLQTRAAAITMWDQNSNDLFSINPGNVGISTGAPQARFHVYASPGASGNILLLSTGTSDILRVTGEGKVYSNYFYGNGTGLSGLLLKAGDAMTGPLTLVGSSLTVGSPLGLSVAKIRLSSNVEITTTTAALYGGVYISTHVFLPAGAKYYGDGSQLTSVNALDATKVARSGDAMIGQLSILGSSLTIVNSNPANAYSLAVTTDPARLVHHLYISQQGNTGIGTSAPASKLSVQGDILAASGITAQGGLYTTTLLADSVTASSGTFLAVGGYSVETASGIKVNSGIVQAPYFVGDGSLLAAVMGTDSTKVLKAGDTVTGNLVISGSSLTVASYGSQTYAFTVSSDPAMAVYSLAVTTVGNVGIKTANPSSPLEVNSRIKISNPAVTGGGSGSLFINPYNDYGYIHWADDALIADGNINQGVLGFIPGPTRILVYRAVGSNPEAGGLEVFRIRSDKWGNWLFGVGTSAPQEKLHINANTLFGPTMASSVMYVSTTSSGVGISTTSITHKLAVAGGILATSSITARGGYYGDQTGLLTLVSTTAVYVDGNLGVGTPTPGARLDIKETGAETYTLAVGVNSNPVINYDMVVTTPGSVGIGVSNPAATLNVAGDLKLGSNVADSGDARIRLRPLGGPLGSDSTIIFEEAGMLQKAVMGTPQTQRYFLFRVGSDEIDAGGTEVYRILNNGYMQIATGVAVKSSFTVTGEFLSASADLVKIGASTLTVKMDGKVGIGTSSPAELLDVRGAASFGNAVTRSTITAEGFWQPRWLTSSQIQSLAATAAGQVIGNSTIRDLCVSTSTAPGEWARSGSQGASSCW